MTHRPDNHPLRDMLGPVPQWSLGEVEVVEEVRDEGFVRRHVRYGHTFPRPDRERAYRFLAGALG